MGQRRGILTKFGLVSQDCGAGGSIKEGWAVLIPHWLSFLFSLHPQSRGTNDSYTHPADPQEIPSQKNTLEGGEKIRINLSWKNS